MTNNKIGFTCGDVLLIPDFKDALILAGANGMQRTITRVNVMEVPDVIDWVRPGEFLITSGFPFRDQPEAISDIIPQLVERGVAALGIKTKRYIDKIPQRALELANQLDFPIFELPLSVSFSDVVRDIMERVLVQEARELSLLQSRFQKLSQKLLYGKGIEEFLQSLDAMVNNPIILLDDSDHLFLSPQAEQVVQLMDNALIWSQMRDDSNLGISFITIGERRTRVYISAVNDKQYNNCLLILLEWNQESSVVDQLTIDRVGVLVGLEMINAHARREVESKYIDQFLQDWISGRMVTMEDLNIRAEACGCPLEKDHRLYVGLVRWLDNKPTTKELLQAVKKIRIKSFCPNIQVTLLEGDLTFVVSLPPQSNLNTTLDMIFADIQAQFGTEKYSICLGNGVEYPDKLFKSYSDVKKIHHISTICDYREAYIDYKKLGIFQLLYLLPDVEEINDYRDRYIVPMLNYDAKHNTLLFHTLKVYLKHNRNAKKTSLELFTHYNTVTYRIERVCEILGISLDSGDDMLQLHFAVKLNEMRPVEIE
ncbi:PucR family transcriptional regulator ligand-binding domain-containing protein [Paenibacillus sp. 19GGS1-52]|uniref:PucR family transcriptional regulator n=1 Tax=Paenibacillus sp. 19GGS1-52 TaxID=2758563 RepID=UPI001EFBA86E|nr:PucR family transcriptional regulator [Paenibacillus sp. 19GGS1-52]ULO08180.1 PucR family transcriptional regulator ligand-binding domain-containing protein [Paenibacillus sp. 19GGS1-52]